MKGIEVLLTTLIFVFVVIVILVIGLLLYLVGFDIEGRVKEIYHGLSTKDVTENLMIYVGEISVDTGSGTKEMPLVNYFSYLLSMPQYIENPGIMKTPEGVIDARLIYDKVSDAVVTLRDGYDLEAICLKLEKDGQAWNYYPKPLDNCVEGEVCCRTTDEYDDYHYNCLSLDACSSQSGEEVAEDLCCPGQKVCCRVQVTKTLECLSGCDPIYTELDESKCTGGGIAKCDEVVENEIYIPTFDGSGSLIVGVNK